MLREKSFPFLYFVFFYLLVIYHHTVVDYSPCLNSLCTHSNAHKFVWSSLPVQCCIPLVLECENFCHFSPVPLISQRHKKNIGPITFPEFNVENPFSFFYLFVFFFFFFWTFNWIFRSKNKKIKTHPKFIVIACVSFVCPIRYLGVWLSGKTRNKKTTKTYVGPYRVRIILNITLGFSLFSTCLNED